MEVVIRKLKSYKVFHLIADTTSTVPEKVFLVEEELKAIEYALRGKLSMLGLVGPQQALRTAVLNIEQKLTGSSSGVDLELAPGEKAAIFMVQIEGNESSEPICLVLFLTGDSFYYEKPLDTRSIYYLILRFLGDMCSNILLVYDKQIEQDFKSAESCPYSYSSNEVVKLKMINRSVQDIQMKPYPCDVSKIAKFDQQYLDKINLKSLNHNHFVTYSNKVYAEMYKQRYKNDINSIIHNCWKLVFIKKQTNSYRILDSIQKPSSSQNIKLTEVLQNLRQGMQKMVERIADQYLQQANSTAKKIQSSSFFSIVMKGLKKALTSSNFNKQLYFRFICKAVLFPERNTYEVADDLQLNYDICEYILTEIECQSVSQKKQLQQIFFSLASSLSAQLKEKLYNHIRGYYDLMRKHFSKQTQVGEELIETALYNCEIIKSKEGVIQNITLNESFKYCFKQQISKQKLNFSSLSEIQNISVFELKNKAHKLLWIQMAQKANCYKLAVLYMDQIRVLRTYSRHQESKSLDFIFFSENQKAYIMNRKSGDIQHFRIDQLQRLADEKRVEIPLKNRRIFCFDISIFPQVFFYLTEQRNAIYTYKFHEKIGGEICDYVKESDGRLIKSLKTDGRPYEFLKTFNEDIFLILGTKQHIDIIEPTTNGKLYIRFTINLDRNSFRGLSVFADRINEYLVVHDAKESAVYAFTNMSARNILEEQTRQRTVREGNPILDIFREAVDKFGDYSTQIQLMHLTQLDSAVVQAYSEELSLKGHTHVVLKPNELPQALQRRRILTKEAIMEIVLTRIPIQICTIQQGNLQTLVAGKRERSGHGKSMSIAQRSRMLNFGIIEEIMTREADKRVIVVSVMGAQSTGKSYLMNRLFGTRFTVASSRTTDGLWISLVEGKQFNYLLIDCQGLFSLERSPKEEEKLIKVIASLSDYSIMNQNMSLTSRTFSELMDRISAACSSDNFQGLYRGELFVVVRDVESNKFEDILSEFKRCFEVSERNNTNNFIKKLFGGDVQLFTVSNFLLPQFKKDIQTIRRHLDQQGNKRPVRHAKDIIDSLKIVMTQLMCDDIVEFGANMDDYRLERVKQEVMELWRKGQDQNSKFVGIVKGINIQIQEKSVCLAEVSEQVERQEKNELKPFFELLKNHVIKDKLSTIDFNKTYRQFNNFIIGFFEKRRNLVEKFIESKNNFELKNVNEDKKNNYLSKIRKIISEHVSKLRLCLQTCCFCKLLCVSP